MSVTMPAIQQEVAADGPPFSTKNLQGDLNETPGAGEGERMMSEGTDMEVSVPSSQEQESSPAPTPPSSLSSPLLPLPDFMTVLNMRSNPTQGAGSGGGANPPEVENEEEEESNLSLGPGSKEVLVEKFRKDPNDVLDLLQSALSMEKLSTFLSEEHKGNSELLLQLQNRLEAAYHTLKECECTKKELAEKITHTNLMVGEKRRHMEELRGELKILGNEELKLKRRKDDADLRYFEVKRVLNSSVEAIEQISHISKTLPTSSLPAMTTPTATPPEGAGDMTTPTEGVGEEEAVTNGIETSSQEEEQMAQEP